MKITIHNTDKIVQINGIPARVWEGETESGIKLHALITRVAIDKDEPRSKEFDTELMEQPAPCIAHGIPLRMII